MFGGSQVQKPYRASTNDFLPWYLNIVKNALGLFAQGENVSAVPPVFRVWLCTLSVLIYCVPVTWNWRWSLLGISVRIYGASDWICGWVHCSRATSTTRLRKLAPTASSLCFSWLCTPPCHGIWLIDRDIYCPDRVDNCFLGLHYTFGERKLSTGFWIIAIKFVLWNEFGIRCWERGKQ